MNKSLYVAPLQICKDIQNVSRLSCSSQLC